MARRALQCRPSQWVTLALPVRDFRLVTRGTIREQQYELDAGSVVGMGITIADGRNGPFNFEIQWLRAFEGVDGIPFFVGDPASSHAAPPSPPSP